MRQKRRSESLADIQSESICVLKTLSREDDGFDVRCGLCIPGVM